MKYWLLIYAGLSIIFNLNGQNRYDYTWIAGYDYFDSIQGSESTLIEFSEDNLKVKYQKTLQQYALGSSIAMISNRSNGKLLFYTNGCAVFDSTHNIMENGDSINFGSYWQNYCQGGSYQYYPISLGCIVLPNNYINDEYYLIHQQISETPVKNYTLNFSIIKYSENYPDGRVYAKNSKISNDFLTPGFVTAVKAANGKDWWLIHLLAESNKYVKFLLDSTGLHFVEYQSLGGNVKKQHAQSQFSHDGKYFAWYNQETGLHLFDFGRQTGLLSNHRNLLIDQGNQRGGLCFSPNSRYLYLFNIASVYQLDLWNQDMMEGLVKVGEYSDSTSESRAQSFLYGMLAPNCKIYITSTSGAQYFSAIENPDEKGLACGFNAFGLKLAYYNFVAAIPNFPQFRVDEELPCSKNISYSSSIPQIYNLYIFPNPSSGFINFQLEEKGILSIFDTNGRSVYQKEVDESNMRLDVSLFNPGHYVVVFEDKHRVYRGEFVKM